MDKHLEEEGTLAKKLQEELPMSQEMPPHVRAKAMNIAIETNRRAQAARRPRTVAWLTAGIAALAFGAMFLSPKQAKAWSLVTQAVQKITSFQMEVQLPQSTELGTHTVNIAAQGNKFMVDAGTDGKLYFDGASMQTYDGRTNKVTKMTLPVEVTGFMPMLTDEIVGAFNLKKEIAEMEEKYGKDHIRVMPIRNLNGRQVYDVQMTEVEGNARAFLTIDAATDLPIFIDASGSEKGDDNFKIVLRYNDDVVIKPNFPANAKVEEIDMSKLDFQNMPNKKDFEKMFDGMSDVFGAKGERPGQVEPPVVR